MSDEIRITIKEAAAMLGLTPDYFRRFYCDPRNPVLTLPKRCTASRPGARRPNIMVLKSEVDALL